MRTVRVYSEIKLSPGSSVELGKEAAHHVSKVLRLRVGDDLQLFDDSGNNFAANITAISKQTVSVDLGTAQVGHTESALHSCLWLGVCRGGRMDYVIQKATELGVSSIRPVITERCVVRLGGDRAASRQAHWQRIAIAAAEQSGRVRTPDIALPMKLSHLLDEALPDRTQHLILDPRATHSLGALMQGQTAIALLTGPEGGFTAAEVSRASAAGFQGGRLGPRILRSDTAPLAALSLAQYLSGDSG